MPNVYFDTGWSIMQITMSGSGRRTFVTPWITKAALDLSFRSGDRLLIQGDPMDFIKGTSDIATVEKLLQENIVIKVNKNLHAKVYVREVGGGAVGWLGSANLTKGGKGGAVGNVEAMVGPIWLDDDFINHIESFWENSKDFNLSKVIENIKLLELEQTKTLEQILGGADQLLMAVRVNFRAGLGRCTLRADWLNIQRQGDSWKGVTFPTVPYLLSNVVDSFRSEVRDVLDDLVSKGAQSIGDSLYLFSLPLKPYVEKTLTGLQDHLKQRAHYEVEGIDFLRIDFQKRFVEVLDEFAKKEEIDLHDNTRKNALESALEQFDHYMQEEPFSLGYSFFISIPGSDDKELEKAVVSLNKQSSQAFLFSDYSQTKD